jgi:hypothetical protein
VRNYHTLLNEIWLGVKFQILTDYKQKYLFFEHADFHSFNFTWWQILICRSMQFIAELKFPLGQVSLSIYLTNYANLPSVISSIYGCCHWCMTQVIM